MRNGDLEFRDWPMFDRVLEENYDICRRMLEVVLKRPIERVENVVAERSIKPRLGSRGVRLDALVSSGDEVFDVEMQRTARGDLGKRLRYYQGAIDSGVLREGAHYDALPSAFVIFLCTYDEFGRGLPLYTFDVKCEEEPSLELLHGFTWVVLNACAWELLADGTLKSLLKYTLTGINDGDKLVGDIAKAVASANEDAIWREDCITMLTFEEDMRIQQRIGMRKATEEGLAKGMAQGLAKGMAQGIAQGMADGLVQGERRMGKLIEQLLSEGREEEALRAATDEECRAALFEKYGL